jgi:hypothetical protein
MTVKLIDGFAEWKGNEECLFLTYWYIQEGKLGYFQALCPHTLSSVSCDQPVSPEHISSAITWLEKEAIPNAKVVNASYREGFEYSPEYRGYLVGYPIDEVDKWPNNDLDKIALASLKSASFSALIRRAFSMPDFLRETLQAQQITQMASNFISSEKVQTYLKKKAEYMANFWANRIGGIGSSGNMVTDGLRVLARKGEEFAEQDVIKFREVLASHSFKSFNQGKVPSYSTSYGIEGDLREVIEENDLIRLARHFPCKTWKSFDFDDAIKLLVEFQEECALNGRNKLHMTPEQVKARLTTLFEKVQALRKEVIVAYRLTEDYLPKSQRVSGDRLKALEGLHQLESALIRSESAIQVEEGSAKVDCSMQVDEAGGEAIAEVAYSIYESMSNEAGDRKTMNFEQFQSEVTAKFPNLICEETKTRDETPVYATKCWTVGYNTETKKWWYSEGKSSSGSGNTLEEAIKNVPFFDYGE